MNKFTNIVIIQSKVEIDPAMQRDAGYYECQAYNKHAVDVKVNSKKAILDIKKCIIIMFSCLFLLTKC